MSKIYRSRSLLARFLFPVLIISALLLTSVGVLAAPARAPEPMQSSLGNFIGPPLGIMPDGGPIVRVRVTVVPLVTCPRPGPDPACNMTY